LTVGEATQMLVNRGVARQSDVDRADPMDRVFVRADGSSGMAD